MIARFNDAHGYPIWATPLPDKLDELCVVETDIYCGSWKLDLSYGLLSDAESVPAPRDDTFVKMGSEPSHGAPGLTSDGQFTGIDYIGFFDPENTYARTVSINGGTQEITIVSSGMNVAAFEDEKLLWNYDGGMIPLDPASASWTVVRDTVVVGVHNRAVGLDTLTGTERWKVEYSGTPLGTDHRIYLPNPATSSWSRLSIAVTLKSRFRLARTHPLRQDRSISMLDRSNFHTAAQPRPSTRARGRTISRP